MAGCSEGCVEPDMKCSADPCPPKGDRAASLRPGRKRPGHRLSIGRFYILFRMRGRYLAESGQQRDHERNEDGAGALSGTDPVRLLTLFIGPSLSAASSTRAGFPDRGPCRRGRARRR